MLIKHGNNALSNVTAFPSAVPTGKLKLLSTATASSSSSIEFTSGIDSTYDIYKFIYTAIHPANDNVDFMFQGSTNGGSSYGITITSSVFSSWHDEADTQTFVDYQAGGDLAQSTSNQRLIRGIGNDNDQNGSGVLYLFQPSSSTYVKHFLNTGLGYFTTDFSYNDFTGGYFNSTSAINAIKFVAESGNIDAGTIKMYGISA